jgi:hypothetical protein
MLPSNITERTLTFSLEQIQKIIQVCERALTQKELNDLLRAWHMQFMQFMLPFRVLLFIVELEQFWLVT